MTELPLENLAESLPIDQIDAGIEAILLVADSALNPLELATVLQLSQSQVEESLQRLTESFAAGSGGIELRQIAGGYRLATSELAAPWVERYVRDGQVARLTQAALETLAVIAYKQPVSRARISAIRGVNVDSVVKTLESRGLIEVAATEPDSGALLYRTTNLFLEKLGINSLGDLPEIAQHLPDISTALDLSESL